MADEQYSLSLKVDTSAAVASLDRVQASLTRIGKSADDLQGKLTKVKEPFRDLSKNTDELAKSTKKAANENDRLAKAGDKTEKTLTSTKIAAAAVAAGLTLLAKRSIDAAVAMERIDNSMLAATGSVGAASAALDFVDREVNRLGLDLRTTASDFASLSAASKGTALEGQATRDIFSAVAEASTVMGLSADQAGGALTAIQQIISKGTVSAEELRGQLGERLPGAFQIAARAMGVSTSELGKMLQQGQVMAEDLLPKMAVELRETFGPGLERAVNSTQAQFNRFGTAVFKLQAVLGEQLAPAVADIGTELSKLAQSKDFQSFASDIGRSAAVIIRAIGQVISWVGKLGISWSILRSTVAETQADIVETVVGGLSLILEAVANGFALLNKLKLPGPLNIKLSDEGIDALRKRARGLRQLALDLGSGFRDVADEQAALAAGSMAAARELEIQASVLEKNLAPALSDVANKLQELEEKKLETGENLLADLNRQIAAQVAINAAYAEGEGAVAATRQEQELLAQISEATAKASVTQAGAIIDALRQLSQFQSDELFAQTQTNLNDQIDAARRLAEAHKVGIAEVQRVNEVLEDEATARQLLAGLTDDQRIALEPFVDDLIGYRREVEELSGVQGMQRQIEQTEAMILAWGEGKEAVEQMTLAMEIYQQIVDQGALGNQELIRQITELALRQNELDGILEKAQAKAQASQEIFGNFLEGVQSNFADTFRTIFDEGFSGFDDFFDSITDLFLDMLAEWVAQLAITKLLDAFGGPPENTAASSGTQTEGIIKNVLEAFLTGAETGGEAVAEGGERASDEMGAGGKQAADQMVGGGQKLASMLLKALSSGGGNGAGNLADAASGAGAFAAVLGVASVALAVYELGDAYVKRQEAKRTVGRIEFQAGLGGRGLFGTGVDAQRLGEMRAGADAMLDALRELEITTGSSITLMEDIRIAVKANGRVWLTIGDQIAQEFNNLQDAVDAALTQSLRSADISSGGPIDLSSIVRSGFSTLEELNDKIALAMEAWRIDATPMEEAFFDLRVELQQALEDAAAADIDPDAFIRRYKQQLMDLRDEITGVERDEHKERMEMVGGFNDELAKLLEELRSKKTDLAEELSNMTRGTFGQDLAELTEQMLSGAISTEDGMAQAEAIIAAALENLSGISLKGAQGVFDNWRKIAQEWLAVSEDLGGLPSPIDPSEVKRRGGGRGGDRQQRREALESTLTDIERSTLPNVTQQLISLTEQFAEMREEGAKLGVSMERIAEAEKIQLGILRDQLVEDPLRDLLGEGGYAADLADIRDRFREIREANEILAERSEDLATSRERIAEIEQKAVENLMQTAIDGFGLPINRMRAQVDQLANALTFLKSQLEEGALSSERFGEVLLGVMAQAENELFGLAAGILESMGADQQAAALRARLEEANFHLQVAQLNFLFQQYSALGILSEGVMDILREALAFINDPQNFPVFGPGPVVPRIPTPSVPGRGTTDRDSARERVEDQIEQWRRLQFGELTRQAMSLTDELDEMREAAREAGISVSRVDAAFRHARRAFIDDVLRPFEDLDLSPLEIELRNLEEQFADIRAAFQEIGATAADWDRLADAQDAAFRDFWERATAPLRDLLEELQATDPRRTSEEDFVAAQDRFRDLAARAQSGDLEALAELDAAARDFRDQAQIFLGGGVGSLNVLDEITATLERLTNLGQLPGDGDGKGGSGDGPVKSEIQKSNQYLRVIAEAVGGSERRSRQDQGKALTRNEPASLFRVPEGGPTEPIIVERTIGGGGNSATEGWDPAARAALLRLAAISEQEAQKAAEERTRGRSVDMAELDQAHQQLRLTQRMVDIQRRMLDEQRAKRGRAGGVQ